MKLENLSAVKRGSCKCHSVEEYRKSKCINLITLK